MFHQQDASGGLGLLGHAQSPVARFLLLTFLNRAVFWFSRRFPCQGRQYRTRAVSASYHGPDCLGPSYFVGGICPNIEVASFVICSFLFLKNLFLFITNPPSHVQRKNLGLEPWNQLGEQHQQSHQQTHLVFL